MTLPLLHTALASAKPSLILTALHRSGMLAHCLPEVDALFGVPQRADYHPEIDTGLHTLLTVDYAASQTADIAVRWAALLHDIGKGLTPADILPAHFKHEARGGTLLPALFDRMPELAPYRPLITAVTTEHGNIHQLFAGPDTPSSAAVERLVRRIMAIHPAADLAFFNQIGCACDADSHGRTGRFATEPYRGWSRLMTAAAHVMAYDASIEAATPAERQFRHHLLDQDLQSALSVALPTDDVSARVPDQAISVTVPQ